jgi:pyruvyltransferase
MPSLYYWRGTPNFGDALSPLLVKHFAGITMPYANADEADVFSTGSVLDVLPDGFSGIVAGSDKLHRSSVPHLYDATVLGLRGPLTGSGPVTGDPGLLASEMIPARSKRYKLGLLPHWTDTGPKDSLWVKFAHLDPVYINPAWEPAKVCKVISSCERLVTSSLHGLIVADSYGIPRRAERFPMMEFSQHEGGTFKFEDYGASLGQPVEFGKHGGQVAPAARVEELQLRLFKMFQTLRDLVK